MRVKINVTKDDIENGVPGSCFHCPVAIATEKVLKKSFSVEVNDQEITVISTKLMSAITSAYPPAKVARFINAFDEDDGGVKPFSFCIDLPKKCLRKTK